MTDWLIDTLVWTAAIITLVLFLRRPVTRWFGPQMAYALWALPVIRLAMPPLELPAWLNPAPPEEVTATYYIITETAAPIATPDAAVAAPNQAFVLPQLPYLEIGIAIWLIGAAIFLYTRFESYFRLRAELLEGGREAGRYGRVRLIETPGTNAPLALGVIDPIIAMPQGFLAQQDRVARDLAIAHELAHHRGHDLLTNFIVQPLFALHWFNPLSRYGWLAMRRDQEAACDARVLANSQSEERGIYAKLIASFATAPNVTLAAPMACPVLGEKSIIHRLRSMNMSEVSPRRRMAGRIALGAAVIALPLTASITYAASDAPSVPAPPAPPAVTLAPPAPPAPPAAIAPLGMQAIQEIDPDVEVEVDVDADEKTETRVYVLRAEDKDESGKRKVEKKIERKVAFNGKGERLSDEEIEKIMVEVRAGLAEADKELAEVDIEIAEAIAEAGEHRTVVKMECKADGKDVSWTSKGKDGNEVVHICKANIMAEALQGLKEARAEIAKDKEITGKMRKELLATLDAQIKNWEKQAK